MIKLKNKKLLIIGAGGHAKVILDTLSLHKKNIIAVFDKKKSLNQIFKDKLHIRNAIEFEKKISPNNYFLINGIGIVPGENKLVRKSIFNKYKKKGFTFLEIIHPSAIISKSSVLEEGVNVMAGSVIQAGTTIKKNTIINSRVTIDHDCIIGENVHIAPGAILCGNVKVGNNAFIGAGSIILPGARIEKNKIIPAGNLIKC